MLRVHRTYLLLGLLTCSTIACSEATDLLDGDDGADEGTDDGALTDEDDDDEAPSTGSARDAGAGQGGDAAASSARDAGASPGGDASTSSGDAGGTKTDAGAAVSDAGTSASVCAETDDWTAQAAAFEDEVLTLTNAARAAGHNCDSKGSFGPAGPLKMQNQLRCAARLHTAYMATTGEFEHTQSATGKDPGARLKDAGYRASTWGENIAWGQRTPQEVVNGWLDSDGHCANIMNPSFTEIGVGYAVGNRSGRAAPYWTQDFGKSR